MGALIYSTASSEKDLLGIINLQQQNLADNLKPTEISHQGFVTVQHNLNDLEKMNAIVPQVICKDDNALIAYLLAMTARSQYDIAILIPMFELFKNIRYEGKAVADYNYIVVGQVCIAKAYRGSGILDACYAFYRKIFQSKYDFAITEIATRNQRSMKAHQRIGFKEIYCYTSADDEEWSIVLWKW